MSRQTDSLFCWLELDPTNDRWRVISHFIPTTNATSLLVARSWREGVAIAPIARQHHHDTGRRVRLARYGTLETLDECG
jgi:phage gp29-like protein